jgi:hypothetical protein
VALLAVLAVCLCALPCTTEALEASTSSASTAAVEINGVRLTLQDVPKDAVLASLYPAELEVVMPVGMTGPAVLGGTSSPFTYSIPVNLTMDFVNRPNPRPVFGVIGDAMGALGFPGMCDIEHYFNHTTELPCPERSGWATKLSADYGDNVPMFHIMIRSTKNAERAVVPLVLRLFKNDTAPLKLVVLAFGSKYTSLPDEFAYHLASMTRTFKARGIAVVLMTRPPVNPQPKAPLWMNSYNTTLAAMMAQAVRDVAAQTDTPCLDIYGQIRGLGDRWTVSVYSILNTYFGLFDHVAVIVCMHDCCSQAGRRLQPYVAHCKPALLVTVSIKHTGCLQGLHAVECQGGALIGLTSADFARCMCTACYPPHQGHFLAEPCANVVRHCVSQTPVAAVWPWTLQYSRLETLPPF